MKKNYLAVLFTLVTLCAKGVDALKEVFPSLSNDDAICIAIGGLKELLIDSPSTYNSVLTTFKKTAAQVNAVDYNRQIGSSGTPCP